ncbi:MAG: RNA-binding S4 domain-containing protein [bacterium]
MRIDKYLWCTRYYKTRNQATVACKKGQIKVSDKTVRASREVYPQDQISLRKNQIEYKLIVNDIPKSRVGAKLVDLYRTDITPKSAFEQQEMQKLAQDYYRKKGEGRPTKKDRRDIDEYLEESEESNEF